MEILTLATRQELKKHSANILGLFSECFGAELSPELWNWAYIENPNAEPVVSLCYDGGKLVAHYAVISMPLLFSERRLNSYLSMTTMVAPDYRKHGLFVKLATDNYSRLKDLSADFVFGFPNSQSAPGFRKRLGWELMTPDLISTCSKDHLVKFAGELCVGYEDSCVIGFSDEKMRRWRFSKPGVSYSWVGGIAYKQFNDSIDIMYFSPVSDFSALPDVDRVNLIVPADLAERFGMQGSQYQFGGVSLNAQFPLRDVRRQMSMSDVF